ncbi:MAG TPA: ectoine hydroxylase, partial [Sphingobium sp.]|nr:ectoine hydroxylase [Sphingobium sp.]
SNRLAAPFGVDKPRPAFIAARGEPQAIAPVTGSLMEEALA